jgi:hypothetical protein
LVFHNSPLFRPFFGQIHNIVAMLAVALLGGLVLALMLSRGWFRVIQPGARIGLLIAASLDKFIWVLPAPPLPRPPALGPGSRPGDGSR